MLNGTASAVPVLQRIMVSDVDALDIDVADRIHLSAVLVVNRGELLVRIRLLELSLLKSKFSAAVTLLRQRNHG